MAAFMSRANSCSLAKCFLQETHRIGPGTHRLTKRRIQCVLQEASLHTIGGNGGHLRSKSGLHHNGRFVLAGAMPFRSSSSQISAVSAPVLAQDTPSVPADPAPSLVPETIPVADSTSVISQPITEQAIGAAPTALDVLQGVEPELSLSELGLGSHTPVGLIQNVLEFIHVDIGLPWWGAIVAGTVLARCAVFPLIVKGQREAAKLNNVLPEMTKLTERLNEAKRSGNKFEFSKACSDMMMFQKKHDVNPMRGFLVPLVQAPVFISFFTALRKMAYLPVPSLQVGGLWWFSDLTAADPYYILPLAVTGTMFAVMELGAESGVDNPNLRTMKTVLRILPFAILPFTINFPTAVFVYWLSSNVFSLGQVALLRHPAVREKLRIPKHVSHAPSTIPASEGLIKSLKKSWKNAKLAQQLEEREWRIKNHLEIAAKSPLKQTFSHNPLQQTAGHHVAAKPANPKAAVEPAGGKKRPWEERIG
ncbi:hypothetical protein AGOR_G00187280 [Albula goreensis]|uniref:Membrane insertase YidC/Oxa/ALB C-terminal domain-containing protein n=1 Tax=Albula goreensis TaxID=1534307 RepID=A0A8T3D1F1_9TELE|nr:hypothetical protein AGOR_G00187280 [Albula goreensis]